MKRIVLTAILCVAGVATAFSQAKKPTLMVVPSDAWCVQQGYVTEFDNQGTVEVLPDYNKAIQNNTDLLLAMAKLGEMMAAEGFPLKDLGASLRQLRNMAAEESVTTSSDGDDLAESPLDKLKRVANADIWMQLTFTINKTGPKHSLTFILQGLDAYTNKQIASASGTGKDSFSVEVPVLLEESIASYMPAFTGQLQTFFDDLFANGREIALSCRRWNGSDVDFETEFDGEELGFLIEEWLADNTVQGRFSTAMATENRLEFEQVRIPLENARGRAIDARTWANDLRRELQTKYGVDAKVSTRGLGQAIVTIGGK